MLAPAGIVARGRMAKPAAVAVPELPQGVPSDKPSLRKAAIAVLRVDGARLREQLRTPTSHTVTPDAPSLIRRGGLIRTGITQDP
jgi:hypothetical protein